jgi:hypothetical protein
MTRNGKTEGACAFCGRRATRGGMSRHLQTCAARRAANRAADAQPGEPEPVFHLQVQTPAGGDFWLHLEMRGSATLKRLDAYLRAIWLECCGHLSRFTRGGWGEPEIPMTRRAREVLGEGVALTHIYDFGTSTLTMVKVVGMREGRSLDLHPIRLMARNDMPAVSCARCDEPATRLCVECMYAMTDAVLCEAHAAAHEDQHEHEHYGEPLPLVNSPRLGVCGYEGPAEPPY